MRKLRKFMSDPIGYVGNIINGESNDNPIAFSFDKRQTSQQVKAQRAMKEASDVAYKQGEVEGRRYVWTILKEISNLPASERKKIFGTGAVEDMIKNHNADVVIGAYEEYKDTQDQITYKSEKLKNSLDSLIEEYGEDKVENMISELKNLK